MWSWVLLLVVACGGSQHREPSQLVVGAGSEPRVLLRQTPALHAPEWVALTFKMRVSGAMTNTTLDTSRGLVDFPSIVSRERVEAIGTAADGSTIVAADIEDVSVLDDVVDPASARLQGHKSRSFAALT